MQRYSVKIALRSLKSHNRLAVQQMAAQQLLVQKRFFSQEPPKQAKNEAKQEKVPKTEEPPKQEQSSGGGSALPLVGGLALLGGIGFMMMNQGGEGTKESTSEQKEEEPVEPTPEMFPVEGSPDLVDVEVKEAQAIEEGMLKQMKVGPGKKDHVVVTRYDGKLYAIGAYCSHGGSPLANGAIFDQKVYSPSIAAYNLSDGLFETAPAIDGLPVYPVNEKDGKQFVRVTKGIKTSQTTPMVKGDPSNTTKMLIIGGEAAGLSCAETLRQSNFTGHIQVLSPEKVLPYDRTLLTTNMSEDFSSLRSSAFLDEYSIEYNLGYEVTSIDSYSKCVYLADGTSVSYDKLLIATGGKARAPSNEGCELQNVHVLKTAQDHESIQKAAKDAKSIVVVGGDFVGSEVTAALSKAQKGRAVHFLCDTNVPVEGQLGYDVGSMLMHEHYMNGVKVYIGANPHTVKFAGDKDGKVKKVVLDDGHEIPADLVVVAAGSVPDTQLARAAGLDVDFENMGIKVNPFMQTSDPNIFAVGEIGSFPNWFTGSNLRLEHANTAQDQGTYAAWNMLGKMLPYGSIPTFTSTHYGKGLQFVGNSEGYEEIHVDGVPRNNDFIAYYIKGDKVLAACSQGRSQDLLTIYEAMNQNLVPPAQEIISGAETPSTISQKLRLNKGGAKCKRENYNQKKQIVQ